MKNKCLIFSVVLIVFSANAFGQSGGPFEITQSVIASGGGLNSAGGSFTLDGTIGQSLAGNSLSGSPFTVTSGFWNFAPLAPTAASVTISGRVRTANGNGIRNVLVRIIAPNGTIQTALTGSFGYFQFENIPVGDTYIFTVFSQRFTFSQPTQVRTVFEDVADITFIADE